MALVGMSLRSSKRNSRSLCLENQVMEWHKKMEEIRLQELRNARELVAQKEENQYLKNLVAEQERNISSLEKDIVHQNMVRIKKKKKQVG